MSKSNATKSAPPTPRQRYVVHILCTEGDSLVQTESTTAMLTEEEAEALRRVVPNELADVTVELAADHNLLSAEAWLRDQALTMLAAGRAPEPKGPSTMDTWVAVLDQFVTSYKLGKAMGGAPPGGSASTLG